jgi:hypothetical protein
MKHWDLNPKEYVTLVREDGHRIQAYFLFRDTIRACFTTWTMAQKANNIADRLAIGMFEGRFREFLLTNEGDLRDVPTRQQMMDALGVKVLSDAGGSYGSPSNFANAKKLTKAWEISRCTASKKTAPPIT